MLIAGEKTGVISDKTRRVSTSLDKNNPVQTRGNSKIFYMGQCHIKYLKKLNHSDRMFSTGGNNNLIQLYGNLNGVIEISHKYGEGQIGFFYLSISFD